MSTKTPLELIEQLLTHGGAIVSSEICSEMEISFARAEGRFAVDENGLGFVRRFNAWVEKAKADHQQVAELTRERDMLVEWKHQTLAIESQEKKKLSAALARAEAGVEALAEMIYDIDRACDPEGSKHPWQKGGNSLKQDEARRKARAAIDAATGGTK